jgi:signal transduction histidine kinase
VYLSYRWLVALGLLGFALVAWLLWAMNYTSPPPWPVLVANLVAVVGLCVGPWLVLVARQLSRIEGGAPAAVGVYSRVLTAVAILAVGGPIAAVLLVALFSDMENPEVAAGLGGLSILSAAAVAIVGAVLAPWFYLVTRTLARERSRRVRAEERAAVAAHLHDSVLQALTLIQKHADDSPSVRRLARGTERELRGWLYGSPPPSAALVGSAGVADSAGDDFAAAVRAAAEEVEDRFDVAIELVAVGTCPLDGPARAVVGAVREALTNAAKHAEVRRVSVFTEVAGAEMFALVRDRGRGFDAAASGYAADRRGIADSIEARMAVQGGTAVVRSVVGAGTEVELRMPLRRGSG